MRRCLCLLLIPFVALYVAVRIGWEGFSEIVAEVWRDGR